MKKLLILFATLLLSYCSKEYSCEGDCGGDTTVVGCTDCVPGDTTHNPLMIQYNFDEADTSAIKKIYANVQTKYIPGHYQIIDTVPVQGSGGHYVGSFDLKSYKLGAGVVNLGRIFYDSCFQKRDTFRYFFEVRYRDATYRRTDTVTLIL